MARGLYKPSTPQACKRLETEKSGPSIDDPASSLGDSSGNFVVGIRPYRRCIVRFEALSSVEFRYPLGASEHRRNQRCLEEDS